MTNRDAERLRRVNDYDSLLRYLQEELEWPIDNFQEAEEISFAWSPEELGVKADQAAAIKKILQLQPPTEGWPWGIFYVEFEKKRLPITILRRALAGVVRKKVSALNSGVRWSQDDLIFITSYGEEHGRQLSFACFETPKVPSAQIPRIKVLGWDELDTGLSLDFVAVQLRSKLKWPENPEDVDEWRSQWREAFATEYRQVANTSKGLAIQLAALARKTRARISELLEVESETGPLRRLMADVKSALVHAMDHAQFADMYAQTLAYGLFSARVTQERCRADGGLLDVPLASPFLRGLLRDFTSIGNSIGSGGVDFDELGVLEIVELLEESDIEQILRGFGDRRRMDDPVTYFFEGFLSEYDPEQRALRGVFYTPQEAVAFIVKSVDEALRRQFGIEDGLAGTDTWGEVSSRIDGVDVPPGMEANDEFISILDPATGTGTFLVECIELINQTMRAKWAAAGICQVDQGELWQKYVEDHLISRLHGFELMMASYSIAHLKVALKLFETGFTFSEGLRLKLCLTNALEREGISSQTHAFASSMVGEEASLVREVKARSRFTVIFGNPPYSKSMTDNSWIRGLMSDWRCGVKEKKIDLMREEWKFLRFAQWHLRGVGVIGFVINRDILDGITKRGARRSLMDDFADSLIVDLNGDAKGNVRDGNIFDIQQGVAVVILAGGADGARRHLSMLGDAQQKREQLSDAVNLWGKCLAAEYSAPAWRWREDSVQKDPYDEWIPLNECFLAYSSGIQTQRDGVCVHYTAEEVKDVLDTLQHAEPEVARERLFTGKDGRDWKIESAAKDVRKGGGQVIPFLYRPMDIRFTFWTGRTKGFHAYPRRDGLGSMVGSEGFGLVFMRQVVGPRFSPFSVSKHPVGWGTFYLGNKGADYVAPMFVSSGQGSLYEGESKLNLSEAAFESIVGGRKRLALNGAAPADLFFYLVAITHYVGYLTGCESRIRSDFARIPSCLDVELFHQLAKLGQRIARAACLEVDSRGAVDASDLDGERVHDVNYEAGVIWVDKERSVGVRGVDEDVWEFHIGGYQVLRQWLKGRIKRPGRPSRPGPVLSAADVQQIELVAASIEALQGLTVELEQLVEEFGGWPRAFSAATSSDGSDL